MEIGTEGNWLEHRDSNVLDLSARLGKHSRMKNTIPKRLKEREDDNHIMRSCDYSEDEDFDAPTPPEDTPIEKRRRKVDRREIERTTLHGSKTLEEQGDHYEELDDFCNFRRFSSRKRKQTDFLGVEYDHVINGCDLKGRRRQRGRRLLGRASRRLVFPLEPPIEEAISGEENSRNVLPSTSSLELREELLQKREVKNLCNSNNKLYLLHKL